MARPTEIGLDMTVIRQRCGGDPVLLAMADTLEKWGMIIVLGEQMNISPDDVIIDASRDSVEITAFGDTNRSYLPVARTMRIRPR